MGIRTLQRLLADAEQNIKEAETTWNNQQLQYWRGRADSYREMLNAEIDLKSKALCKSKLVGTIKEGSPAFISTYNITATALGLPTLATVTA